MTYKEIFELLREKAKNKNVTCCKYGNFVNQSKYNKNKRAWDSSLVLLGLSPYPLFFLCFGSEALASPITN